MDTVALGKKIKEARIARGLTQEELSSRIGISIQHLSVLERGLKEMRLSTFVNLLNELGLSPYELLPLPEEKSEYGAVISHEVSKLPVEKQEKVQRIVQAIIKEL